MDWRRLCAVSFAPRDSTRRSVCSTAAGLTSAIGSEPSQGNTSLRMSPSHRAACRSLHSGSFMPWNSRATASKVVALLAFAASQPCSLQRHFGVAAQRHPTFLAVGVELPKPALGPAGRNLKVQAPGVGQANALLCVGALRVAAVNIGEHAAGSLVARPWPFPGPGRSPALAVPRFNPGIREPFPGMFPDVPRYVKTLRAPS